ncbi:MAG: polysaccharide export protein [Planctomycetes bacterium]|nr:polysaccharide export protein [Planctomycetota bacterium]
MKTLRRIALLLASLVAFVACRALPEEEFPGNGPAGSLPEPGVYRVAVGDLLEVRFPAYPQWNADVLVRDDGRATLPLVGDIAVAGQAIDELRADIERGLTGRIRSPRIELALKEQRPREVYVGGEVTTPGRIAITSPTLSIEQAVFAAGGPLRETAKLDSVVLVRLCTDGKRRAWRIDMARTLSDSLGSESALLLPGDVVFVPNTRIDEINLFVAQYVDRMVPVQNLVSTGVILGAAK